MSACKKHTVEESNSPNAISLSGFKANVDPINSIGLNLEDPKDQMINEKLTIVLMAFKQLVAHDPTINSFISKTLQSRDYPIVRLSEILAEPVYAEQLNNFFGLESSISGKFSGNSLEALLDEIEYDGVYYQVVVHVLNEAIADFLQYPILTAAIEVQDNPELGIIDCIFSYYMDDEGIEHEIALSQEDAMVTTNPIYAIIIELADSTSLMGKSYLSSTAALPQSSLASEVNRLATTTTIQTKYMKINERYESAGNSELHVVVIAINSAGFGSFETYMPTYNNLTTGTVDMKLLREFPLSEIGDLIESWKWMDIGLPAYTSTTINTRNFLNTFEYDWANSEKTLGICEFGSKSVEIGGRRKYLHEWYLCDPDFISSDGGWFDAADFPSGTSAKTWSNIKGQLTLRRIDF